jgi:hypothetical protein
MKYHVWQIRDISAASVFEQNPKGYLTTALERQRSIWRKPANMDRHRDSSLVRAE